MALLSDVSLEYGLNPSDTVTDAESAIQKLVTALSVPMASRKRYEEFGSTTFALLFEPFDQITADWLGVGIQDTINNPANEIRDLFSDVKIVVALGEQTYICAVDFRVVLPDGTRTAAISYKFQLAPQGNALQLPARATGLRKNQ